MYRLITFGGVIDLRIVEIWDAKIPLKVQIFLWVAWHDRIQTAQQLRGRNWDGSKFCGKEESVDHLLFQCPIIRVIMWCGAGSRITWVGFPLLLPFSFLGKLLS
jgi:hypothetical protein